MGASASRQDERMLLSMLTSTQRELLAKRCTSSMSLASAVQSRGSRPQRQRGSKSGSITNVQSEERCSSSVRKTADSTGMGAAPAKRFDADTQNHLLSFPPNPTTPHPNGLYIDVTPFAFRQMEISLDFHALDIHRTGIISHHLLGKALSKQFTNYDVVCAGHIYNLCATVEDFRFIWHYGGFRAVTCEVYTKICYCMCRLPRLREHPHIIGYYMYDCNYSQCLALNTFIEMLLSLFNTTEALIKDRIRDYERIHRVRKKYTFGEDDFLAIYAAVKRPARHQHLITQYSNKLKTKESLTPLRDKYKLDHIAQLQPRTDTTLGSTLKAALAHFYDKSKEIITRDRLTKENLAAFNQIRTTSFVAEVLNDYYVHISTKGESLTSPRDKVTHKSNRTSPVSHVGGNNTDGEWSATESELAVKVYAPIFKSPRGDDRALLSHIIESDTESSASYDDNMQKFSLEIRNQEAVSETCSVIYSFKMDKNGRLQEMDSRKGTPRASGSDGSSEQVPTVSSALGSIPTVRVSKAFTALRDFEGDGDVVFTKFGSFCLLRDADTLQVATHLPIF